MIGCPASCTSLNSGVHSSLQSGHALAAAAEGVPCTRVALFLAVCLPGAFVELDDESLAALTPWRVLRVRCRALVDMAYFETLRCWCVRITASTGSGSILQGLTCTDIFLAPSDACLF